MGLRLGIRAPIRVRAEVRVSIRNRAGGSVSTMYERALTVSACQH